MSAPQYWGPREVAVLWQQQPPGEADRWAQVQGEILPPALVGPLLPEHQPRVQVILTEGSTSIARPEVVRLVEALADWLDRTHWSAALPAAPEEVRVPDSLPLPVQVTPSPLAERLAAEHLGHVCQCRHTRARHYGPEYLGACSGTFLVPCVCTSFVLRSGFLP